ncbi:HmuY family protein [Arcticibacterium luteifluviistationis]|uniref:HmuY protein n=1 Tax=Arcticibacterium luteifluviistationis TaxID=1784714 RepID=A0A2Z4GIK2_9BACT|nr:HmuY family protein [Arcticibacterium luteifluviistationis]AWW00704.1 hypothetical protein DJ013_21950 [Arcticibacterium luteifluviistationis]
MNAIKFLTICTLFVGLISCEEDEVVVAKDPVISETVSDLAANPSDAPNNHYTFFSFEDGVLTTADSASTKWDLAFKSTSVIVNGGVSGPGSAQAAVADGIYADFTEVPASLTMKSDDAEGLAIPSGSGNGWYNYSSTTHEISPIAGKVIFVKTSSGNYAKVEILSYYKGDPAAFDATAVGRYYTFRYVYQPDGSTKFE